MGNSITCSINCDCSIAATLCTVVYMVCWSYVIVNIVNRDGDDDDDDDNSDDNSSSFNN